MEPSDHDLSNRNKAAWGRLYQSTPQLIWGAAPVGFIEPFLAPELTTGRRFARALDAAGGEGRNLPVLARLADSLTLCDASTAALAKSATAPTAAVERVRCDLGAMPFGDGTFDFVLLCDVVETLPDPLPVLREIHRVLAPDGLLVCNIPGPEDEVAGVDMTALAANRYLYHRDFFYQFLEQREAEALLAAAGFGIVRQELMRWEEPPHPEFRDAPHHHTSRVFLVRALPPRG